MANGKVGEIDSQKFTKPSNIIPNLLYLDGVWNIQKEYAEAQEESSLIFRYSAKNVYMVLAGFNDAEIEIYQDGELHSKQKVDEETLYTIMENSEYGEHLLEVKIIKVTINAYTFTFG